MVNLLLPSTTTSATLAGLPLTAIQHALDTHKEKAQQYAIYIDYYEGRHNLAFATSVWRNTFGSLFRKFSDNLCAPVVDAAADRLHVTGFQQAGIASPNLWDIWTRNKMDRKAGAVHEHALKTGDSYVIVWPDSSDNAVISPNPATQVCCYYSDDDSDVMEFASKLWQLRDSRWRLTLYYPDRIEKYVTTSQIKLGGAPNKANAFRRHFTEEEPWPLPNPNNKVPVFHFANKPEMGVWGESELSNVLPIQDALNKSVIDMLVAMEYVSFPQRWATGLEFETDPTTNEAKVPFKAGFNRIWANPSEEGRFGQFEQANLQHFNTVQNDFRVEIARISRTPLHYLSLGGSSQNAFVSVAYPSGESLKTAEAPFVAKLRDRQTSFGDVWEEVIAFASLVQKAELDPFELETIWEPPTPFSETDSITNASTKVNDLSIPEEIAWKELGYSDTQIEEMKSRLDARRVELENQRRADAPALPPVQRQRNGSKVE